MPKNPDSLLALTRHERMLCRIGLPAYLWNPKGNNIVFKPTTSRGTKKSKAAQRHWLKTLVTQPARRRPLITIASIPTDTGAMYTAVYCILKMWNLHNYGAAFLNMANDHKSMKYKSENDQPICTILHGLHNKTTDARKEELRDLLNNLHHSFRIVVVGGCDEPESWMTQSVGIYPDAAFLVEDLHPSQLKEK